MFAGAAPFLAVGSGLMGWGIVQRRRANRIVEGDAFWLEDPAASNRARSRRLRWGGSLSASGLVMVAGAVALGNGIRKARQLRTRTYYVDRLHRQAERRRGVGGATLGMGAVAAALSVFFLHRDESTRVTVAPSARGLQLALTSEF